MTKIDLSISPDRLERTLQRVREKQIIIPTFAQMRDPNLIPEGIKAQLKDIGLWDLHPLNLFRITWHNQPKPTGGLFDGVNILEFPSSLTGVNARIIALVGKWFPAGARRHPKSHAVDEVDEGDNFRRLLAACLPALFPRVIIFEQTADRTLGGGGVV